MYSQHLRWKWDVSVWALRMIRRAKSRCQRKTVDCMELSETLFLLSVPRLPPPLLSESIDVFMEQPAQLYLL